MGTTIRGPWKQRPARRPRRSRSGREWSVHRLQVTLVQCRPEVWRTLLVRSDLLLSYLHAVLQVSMGWTNSHLHRFEIEGTEFADPAFGLGEGPVTNVRSDRRATLAQVLPSIGTSALYEYDFGDGWVHTVTVEDIRQERIGQYALCLDGGGACPPEDCGGVGGYMELLEALADKRHPRHEDYLEWLGGPIDPTAFDIDNVNDCLGQLRWQDPTPNELMSVLMARDGEV